LELALPKRKARLEAALCAKHPAWRVKMNKFAVTVYSGVEFGGQVEYEFHADTLFGLPEVSSSEGAHSATFAESRRKALSSLSHLSRNRWFGF